MDTDNPAIISRYIYLNECFHEYRVALYKDGFGFDYRNIDTQFIVTPEPLLFAIYRWTGRYEYGKYVFEYSGVRIV